MARPQRASWKPNTRHLASHAVRRDQGWDPADRLDRFLDAIVRRAEIHPALRYAHAKTGLVVSLGSLEDLSPESLEQWRAAVEEWESQHPNARRTPQLMMM